MRVFANHFRSFTLFPNAHCNSLLSRENSYDAPCCLTDDLYEELNSLVYDFNAESGVPRLPPATRRLCGGVQKDCAVREQRLKRCLTLVQISTVRSQWQRLTSPCVRTDFRQTILHIGVKIKTFSQLSAKTDLFFSSRINAPHARVVDHAVVRTPLLGGAPQAHRPPLPYTVRLNSALDCGCCTSSGLCARFQLTLLYVHALHKKPKAE
jgi:hypothetical protein